MYCEPSQIAQDEDIRVVFFKDSLSTGWDCPRAETMMSFRRAVDATYIAQLLGRMVRTPLQHRVESDDVLNAVRLFLPHFDENTVEDIVKSMQDIPAETSAEVFGSKKYEVLTAKPQYYREYRWQLEAAGQADLEGVQWHSEMPVAVTSDGDGDSDGEASHSLRRATQARRGEDITAPSLRDGEGTPALPLQVVENISTPSPRGGDEVPDEAISVNKPIGSIDCREPLLGSRGDENPPVTAHCNRHFLPLRPRDTFDRLAVADFIDGLKLPTYTIAASRINNYVTSLTRLASFLVRNGLDLDAEDDFNAHVDSMIEAYIAQLKDNGTYEAMQQRVVNFELFTKSADSYGNITGEVKTERDVYHSVQYDVDRCFDNTDGALGRNGAANTYLKRHWVDESLDVMPYQADVILFTADEQCLALLARLGSKPFR